MPINKEQIVDEIMLLLASDGEAESSVHRFQVAAALPDIVRQLISQIITGTFPDGGMTPMKNIGTTGNVPDISNLQNQLRRTFIIPITGVGQASLKDALNDPEPITLEYPFVSVHHSNIDSLYSMFVPDQEMVKELGDIYQEEAIVYTIVEDEFTQDGIVYVPSSVECVDGVDAADCVRDINGNAVSGGCCPDAEIGSEGGTPTECVNGVDGSDCIRDEDGVPIFGNCCPAHPTDCVLGIDAFDCVRDEITGEIISGGCCPLITTCPVETVGYGLFFNYGCDIDVGDEVYFINPDNTVEQRIESIFLATGIRLYQPQIDLWDSSGNWNRIIYKANGSLCPCFNLPDGVCSSPTIVNVGGEDRFASCTTLLDAENIPYTINPSLSDADKVTEILTRAGHIVTEAQVAAWDALAVWNAFIINSTTGDLCPCYISALFCNNPDTITESGSTRFARCGLITEGTLQDLVTDGLITQMQADAQKVIWDALISPDFVALGYVVYIDDDGKYCPCENYDIP